MMWKYKKKKFKIKINDSSNSGFIQSGIIDLHLNEMLHLMNIMYQREFKYTLQYISLH